jgi:ribosomal protein S18 acetylase RimI-like enzyme
MLLGGPVMRSVRCLRGRRVLAIQYEINKVITTDQFIRILERSGLGERRPINDRQCVEQMLENADLLVTAWLDGNLVGVARSVTDFSYCCYLSDLAVDRSVQRAGIGKQLIRLTKERLGPKCKLILLSAPAALDYYPHLGFERHPSAWVLHEHQDVK